MAISDAFLNYVKTHPFDGGDGSDAILEQLYQAYAESHESDPTDIQDGFKELEDFLCVLPLDDNNAVFNLCCRLCSAYEHKAFIDGLLYGAHMILELNCFLPELALKIPKTIGLINHRLPKLFNIRNWLTNDLYIYILGSCLLKADFFCNCVDVKLGKAIRQYLK